MNISVNADKEDLQSSANHSFQSNENCEITDQQNDSLNVDNSSDNGQCPENKEEFSNENLLSTISVDVKVSKDKVIDNAGPLNDLGFEELQIHPSTHHRNIICDKIINNKVENDDNKETNDEVSKSVDIEELLDSVEPGGNHRKHIFILSSAGKPVYTRYGNEDKLVTLFGVMQALVSVVQDSDDALNAIKCGKTCIVFLTKGPIILVGVGHKNDSVDFLKKKLDYIYSQVISILTLTQLTKIFEERLNFDLRRMLSGSERIIDHLLTFTETRPEFLLDSISCLEMPQAARDVISNTIVSSCSKMKNLVFALLIGNDRIISLVSLKKYKLEAYDINLICNLVSCAESFKTAESWTPICLPKFDSSGYLHAHVSYLKDCSACLLLLTVDRDSFFGLSQAKCKIEEKLIHNQSIIILKSALAQRTLPSIKNIDLPFVRHFIYKSSTLSQLIFSEIKEPYETEVKWQDVLAKYKYLHYCMHNTAEPLKVLYQQLANEVMLGWVTKNFELYVVFEPLVEKCDCINTVDKLLLWMQKEEDRLFMMNYHYFN